MQNKGLTLLLLVVVVSITALFGFRPLGSFKPWVTSNAENTAVVFGEYGYLLGSVPEILEPQAVNTAFEITLKLQFLNQEDPNLRVIVNLGGDCANNPINIGQWRTQLIIFQGCDYPNKSAKVRLSSNIEQYIGAPTTATITLNNGGGELRLNGQSVVAKPAVDINPDLISDAALLVGNTPDGLHGWSGTLFDFAIVRIADASLPAEKRTVLRHFDFGLAPQPNQVLDTSGAASHLEIPKIGYFPTRIFFTITPLTSLAETLQFDVLINLIGFAPIGFALALFLFNWTGMSGLKVTLSSVALACLLSLSIELSQAYIAGRQSALHDLILNSAGSILGVIGFWVLVLVRQVYLFFKTEPPTE